MAFPTFLSDGYTPRRTDARWYILVKWLGVVQTFAQIAGSYYAANDPRRNDTRHVLLAKIEAALSNTPYVG